MAIINKALITEQAGPSLFVALSTNLKKKPRNRDHRYMYLLM